MDHIHTLYCLKSAPGLKDEHGMSLAGCVHECDEVYMDEYDDAPAA